MKSRPAPCRDGGPLPENLRSHLGRTEEVSVKRSDRRGWFLGGLVAGTPAIAVNTLLLKIADGIHLDVGHGGLLKLLRRITGPVMASMGGGHVWRVVSEATAGLPAFKVAFHVVVGLLMALFYTAILESALPPALGPLGKGFVYALAVWLLNAAIVLPALGQGFAGSAVLTTGGIVYFAFAHTVFFVLLALFYARWHARLARP